jgi:hypothetical protein
MPPIDTTLQPVAGERRGAQFGERRVTARPASFAEPLAQKLNNFADKKRQELRKETATAAEAQANVRFQEIIAEERSEFEARREASLAQPAIGETERPNDPFTFDELDVLESASTRFNEEQRKERAILPKVSAVAYNQQMRASFANESLRAFTNWTQTMQLEHQNDPNGLAKAIAEAQNGYMASLQETTPELVNLVAPEFQKIGNAAITKTLESSINNEIRTAIAQSEDDYSLWLTDSTRTFQTREGVSPKSWQEFQGSLARKIEMLKKQNPALDPVELQRRAKQDSDAVLSRAVLAKAAFEAQDINAAIKEHGPNHPLVIQMVEDYQSTWTNFDTHDEVKTSVALDDPSIGAFFHFDRPKVPMYNWDVDQDGEGLSGRYLDPRKLITDYISRGIMEGNLEFSTMGGGKVTPDDIVEAIFNQVELNELPGVTDSTAPDTLDWLSGAFDLLQGVHDILGMDSTSLAENGGLALFDGKDIPIDADQRKALNDLNDRVRGTYDKVRQGEINPEEAYNEVFGAQVNKLPGQAYNQVKQVIDKTPGDFGVEYVPGTDAYAQLEPEQRKEADQLYYGKLYQETKNRMFDGANHKRTWVDSRLGGEGLYSRGMSKSDIQDFETAYFNEANPQARKVMAMAFMDTVNELWPEKEDGSWNNMSPAMGSMFRHLTQSAKELRANGWSPDAVGMVTADQFGQLENGVRAIERAGGEQKLSTNLIERTRGLLGDDSKNFTDKQIQDILGLGTNNKDRTISAITDLMDNPEEFRELMSLRFTDAGDVKPDDFVYTAFLGHLNEELGQIHPVTQEIQTPEQAFENAVNATRLDFSNVRGPDKLVLTSTPIVRGKVRISERHNNGYWGDPNNMGATPMFAVNSRTGERVIGVDGNPVMRETAISTVSASLDGSSLFGSSFEYSESQVADSRGNLVDVHWELGHPRKDRMEVTIINERERLEGEQAKRFMAPWEYKNSPDELAKLQEAFSLKQLAKHFGSASVAQGTMDRIKVIKPVPTRAADGSIQTVFVAELRNGQTLVGPGGETIQHIPDQRFFTGSLPPEGEEEALAKSHSEIVAERRAELLDPESTASKTLKLQRQAEARIKAAAKKKKPN